MIAGARDAPEVQRLKPATMFAGHQRLKAGVFGVMLRDCVVNCQDLEVLR